MTQDPLGTSDRERQQFDQPPAIVDVETVQLPAVQISKSEQQKTIIADMETAQVTAVHISETVPRAVTDAETLQLAAVHVSGSIVPASIEDQSERRRNLFRRGLMRLQEPQPEGPITRGLQAIKPEVGLGFAPLFAFTNALGLLIIAASYYVSVAGYQYPLIEGSFFAGLLVIALPNFVRLLSRIPTRTERICLLSMLALACYLSQFMSSPLHFSSFDEFLHWRTADDILKTGHLFSINSMLPVSPYYPGLELVTNAISTTTGLSTFYAGNIVIAVSRLLLVLALYLLYEHLTGSSRMASIGVAIYATNPHFIFFDDIYNYETIALSLAMLMMYILVRYGGGDKGHLWMNVAAWVVLVALNITHHMTSYFFDGLLLLWAIISLWRPTPRGTRIHLTALAVCGLLFSLAYAFLLPGNPVWSYLSEYFGSTFTQLQQIITGGISIRSLFTSAQQTAPIWDRLLIIGSLTLVVCGIPFGLFSIQRLYRNKALAVTLGIASLLYPLTEAFRFTRFGTEITDRAAAFLFLPIGYVLTVLITHFWPTRRLNLPSIALIASAILIIFLGNTTLGGGPALVILPGPYLVVSDARSVEPEGIAAALWSSAYLGSNNRIATDRINQMLMSTYGHQRIVTHLGDNVDVAPIFYSEQFNATDIALLRQDGIRYLIVDSRISTALPLDGLYFENDEANRIISRDGLTKFNTVVQINRLFDSGDIVVYSTEAFIGGPIP